MTSSCFPVKARFIILSVEVTPERSHRASKLVLIVLFVFVAGMRSANGGLFGGERAKEFLRCPYSFHGPDETRLSQCESHHLLIHACFATVSRVIVRLIDFPFGRFNKLFA